MDNVIRRWKVWSLWGAIPAILVLAFPPWTARLQTIDNRALDGVKVSLPWPNPSFRLEGLAVTAFHQLRISPIWHPPTPKPEVVSHVDPHPGVTPRVGAYLDSVSMERNARVWGVWSVSPDLGRLALLFVVAWAVGAVLATAVGIASRAVLSWTVRRGPMRARAIPASAEESSYPLGWSEVNTLNDLAEIIELQADADECSVPISESEGALLTLSANSKRERARELRSIADRIVPHLTQS